MATPRASIFETYQFGVEDLSAKGVQVAANKRILSIEMDCDPVIPDDEVEASGSKGPLDLIFQKEYSKCSLKGKLCYNTLSYLLSSGLCLATTGGSGGVFTWVFAPNVFGPDQFQTYSLEKGSDAGADAMTHGTVTDLMLDFGLKGADMKAEMIAGKMKPGITMTADPEDVDVAPVSPDSLDVFVGDSVDALVRLEDCFKASWGFKDRYKPKFTLNTAQESFKDMVESKFGMTAQLNVEQNSVADDFMADLRAKKLKFCKIRSTGGILSGNDTYLLEILFPFKFRNPKRGDTDSVYAGTYDLLPVYNRDFGGIVEVKLQNALNSL
jgi:hypothetical protein